MALIAPQVSVLAEPRRYDGTQLRSHWIYETCDLRGDAAVAFIGEVEVRGEDLVDLADKREGLHIAGAEMLHVIAESFGASLDRAVFMQRLIVMLAHEQLMISGAEPLRRIGDDIWLGDGKLTVSIATVSAVSCLIHFGINVTNTGTPVKTSALADCGLEPRPFAERLLKAYAEELDGMASATTKVRSVP